MLTGAPLGASRRMGAELGERAKPRVVVCIALSLALAACSGGGDGGGSAGSGSGSSPSAAPAPTLSSADAVRAAKQASFGPTQTLVDHMVSLHSVSAWVDEQAGLSSSNYSDLLSRATTGDHCKGKTGTDSANCNRDYFSSTPVAMEFYAHAVSNDDQLRQRVAFALSQILVASDVEVHTTAGLAAYNQIFLDNAFGNYRDVLKAVTLSPYMGDYLDMANSNKRAPNENYARELMQLFSIGLNALNADGTLQKDSSGAPVPTYTGDDVHSVARALTGWTFARLNNAPLSDYNQLDYTKPMVMNAPAYDTTAKTFLGVTVAANATQTDSMNAVVDAVFNNASTAPHVSKLLIQQLVTANPSPAYVGRVSAVFANNGSGVRGDLKAVVKAILTDSEARGDAKTGASDGKLKEPVLLTLAMARLINFGATDGYAFTARDAQLGQQPFRSPSVFNYYPPDYPLPLGGGLLSPASKLISTGSVVARHNLVYDWTISGDVANRPEYKVQTTIAGAVGTTPDWSGWTGFGTNVDGMIDRINLLMLNNTMTAAQHTALKSAMTAITNTDPVVLARKQAQVALYIVGTSPQFQVDR